MSADRVLEIPKQLNLVFVFTRNIGPLTFHTYHTVEEICERLIPNRDTMAEVEAADQGGAGIVRQWIETVNDGKHEIIGLAIKMAVSGQIAIPGRPS